jgi:hypothetical protein
MSEKAARNRLNSMFSLNLNMMDNQHEGVQCEIVEGNNWIPMML